MDFPCRECKYFLRCFPVLKLLFSRTCQQGRRKKAQAQLTDFPEKDT